ncbi:PAAR domain-containing protein [Providencia rettgeri]
MSGNRPIIMGKAMALNGDKTTTGAICIATIETVTCFNKKALRVGDPTTQCPKCGQAGVVISGQQGFLNHGKLQAVHDSLVQCGCPAGSNRVIAVSAPASIQSRSFTAASNAIDNVNEIAQTSNSQEAAPFILPIQKVCRYCQRPITLSNACQPEFKEVIREFIDSGNDINGVFKELCDYYLKHFDIWKTTYIDTMFSDLHEVVGKNFKTLSSEDKKRFWLLHDQQKKTLFYGDKYSDGNPTDPGYDKVQHIIAGLWLGSNYTYASGVITAWSVEKIDTYKAVFGELTGTRLRHHIGFDWYDYAFTVAGSALGHLLKNVDDDRCLKALTKFTTGQVRFDSFYTPPKLDYLGMGKIDPIFPVSGGNSEKIDNSLDMIFKEF